MSEFTTDWVTHHNDTWSRILSSLGDGPLHMIEIGAWEGRSTCWWLANALTHQDSHLVSIDVHANPVRYKRFLQNVSSCEHPHKVRVLKSLSRNSLPHLPESSYDLVYVDGSHEGRDVLTDACLSFWKLKPGGVLLFDDYKWPNNPEHPSKVLPGPAIDAFLVAFAPFLEVIHKGYQLAVRRTG